MLNRAFNALRGVDALAATSTLQIEANGEARVGFEGSDPSDVVAADTYIRSYSIDLDQNLIRVDVTRQPLFEAFQFFPEENFAIVANQDIGHLSNQALFTFPGDLAVTVESNPLVPADHFENLALADPTAYVPALAEFGRQSHHLVMAFFGAGFTYFPEQPIRSVTELAPGVHHVAAGTGSLIVEQTDGLVSLEAPLSPA